MQGQAGQGQRASQGSGHQTLPPPPSSRKHAPLQSGRRLDGPLQDAEPHPRLQDQPSRDQYPSTLKARARVGCFYPKLPCTQVPGAAEMTLWAPECAWED